MNNRGAVVERSCVRRKDLCARSEIVVYSAVTLTAVCVSVFALERSSEHAAPRRQATLKATPPGAGGGEASSAGASSAGACAVGSAHCADSKHGKSQERRNASGCRLPAAPSPRNGTTKHVSMIHVPRRDVSCVQLQICPLKNEKKVDSRVHKYSVRAVPSAHTLETAARLLMWFLFSGTKPRAARTRQHAAAQDGGLLQVGQPR